MTTPKVPTFSKNGSRLYEHPITGESVPGVTSVLNMLPKPFLKAWAAKMVATAAVEHYDFLGNMVKSVGDDAAIKWLKDTPYNFTKSAADSGTSAHSIFEALANGDTLGPLTEENAAYATHFADFLATVQPEVLLQERTVWSETHAYAGSFDAFMRIGDDAVWVDYKTTRSGVYPEVALQLAAYSQADYILNEDGSVEDMPQATRGAVLRVRPDEGWQLYEVPIGDEVFDHFLHLRRTWEWDRSSRRILGKPLLTGVGAIATEEAA